MLAEEDNEHLQKTGTYRTATMSTEQSDQCHRHINDDWLKGMKQSAIEKRGRDQQQKEERRFGSQRKREVDEREEVERTPKQEMRWNERERKKKKKKLHAHANTRPTITEGSGAQSSVY
jgi:hypothetical protein